MAESHNLSFQVRILNERSNVSIVSRGHNEDCLSFWSDDISIVNAQIVMELRMILDLVYFEHIIQPQHNTSHFVLQTLHIDTTQIKVKYVHSLVGYAHLEDKLVHILRPHPYTFCGTLFDSTSPSLIMNQSHYAIYAILCHWVLGMTMCYIIFCCYSSHILPARSNWLFGHYNVNIFAWWNLH